MGPYHPVGPPCNQPDSAGCRDPLSSTGRPPRCFGRPILGSPLSSRPGPTGNARTPQAGTGRSESCGRRGVCHPPGCREPLSSNGRPPRCLGRRILGSPLSSRPGPTGNARTPQTGTGRSESCGRRAGSAMRRAGLHLAVGGRWGPRGTSGGTKRSARPCSRPGPMVRRRNRRELTARSFPQQGSDPLRH